MRISDGGRIPHPVGDGGANRLSLTLAMSEYEHSRDLMEGLIRPQGIALTPLVLPIEEMAHRYLKYFEFDMAETSFAKYVSLVGAGDAPIVAIPAFPARLFRHSAIYIRKDSSIASPRDLMGRRVGIAEWAQTAGLYVRGLLSEYYGVALDRIEWIQAAVNQPGRVEKVKLNLPESIRYTPRPDSCISDMLASGEIDAAISARPPNSFRSGDKGVVRLFPDFRAEEEAYHRNTGIFPIMHVVTIRRAVLERYPWVAANMMTAFGAAKDAAVERVREITTSRLPLPWGAAIAEEMTQRFGGDLWPYGVEANRHTLDAFCRFAHSQFLTPSLLTLEDLFPAEVIEAVRV
jgi:4,5-dihydroxyphthalate decarboxylase